MSRRQVRCARALARLTRANVTVSAHANERAVELGFSEDDILHCVARPEQTYCSPADYGPDRRVYQRGAVAVVVHEGPESSSPCSCAPTTTGPTASIHGTLSPQKAHKRQRACVRSTGGGKTHLAGGSQRRVSFIAADARSQPCTVKTMKSNYNPITGTSPDDQPDDDNVYSWYGPERAASGLVCPVCFAVVGTTIVSARGHMEWHQKHDI